MRIGGDEFVIVLPSVRDEHEAREIAERTRLTFGTPFQAGAASIPISTSIGVTMAGGAWPMNDAETLLREADTAMYAAKEHGGDFAVTFDKAMHDRVIRRLALEGEIRLAVNRDELSVHYQPIVQVSDGRMTGLEALLRWEHPVLGQVPPSDFIPVCEEIGYIVELGGWVIDEAVGQLAALRAQYPHSDQLSMAINVSARQLRDERLCDHVARAMVKYNLPASALCIEITESLLVENLSAIADTLATLRGFGVRIAIDDFGTGYSSLAYLRRLPVDEIKIDRQFIMNLGKDRSDDSLVAAILAMANSLGYTSVAEGVETDLQLSRLIELGCEHAQGFAFSTPSPAAELPEMVERLGLAAAPPPPRGRAISPARVRRSRTSARRTRHRCRGAARRSWLRSPCRRRAPRRGRRRAWPTGLGTRGCRTRWAGSRVSRGSASVRAGERRERAMEALLHVVVHDQIQDRDAVLQIDQRAEHVHALVQTECDQTLRGLTSVLTADGERGHIPERVVVELDTGTRQHLVDGLAPL